MSLVIAPEWVQAAAQELEEIRSALVEAAAAAAAPTTAVVPAAADEVSAAVAAMLDNLGQEYQLLSAQAQAFHAEFVNALTASAGSYLGTEIANANLGGATAAAGIGDLPGIGLPGLPGVPGLPGLPNLFGTGGGDASFAAIA